MLIFILYYNMQHKNSDFTKNSSFFTNFTNFVIYILSGQILWPIFIYGVNGQYSAPMKLEKAVDSFTLALFHLSFLCPFGLQFL